MRRWPTAWSARGWEVTLVERFEPGDPRSESGGETRLLRYVHGATTSTRPRPGAPASAWRELGVLVECGVRLVRPPRGRLGGESERVLRSQGLPVERLEPGEAERLFPSLASDDLAFGLLEPEAGVLRAGDGVRALVGARAGGAACGWSAARPSPTATARWCDGRALEADHVVWACGGWLARLFPDARAAARHAPGRRPVRRRAGVGRRARLDRLRRERATATG